MEFRADGEVDPIDVNGDEDKVVSYFNIYVIFSVINNIIHKKIL